MRELTIEANGCHDCIFAKTDYNADITGEICELISKFVYKQAKKKTFHPDCPMEGGEEELNA